MQSKYSSDGINISKYFLETCIWFLWQMLIISVSNFLLNKILFKSWSDFFFLPTIELCLLSSHKYWKSIRVFQLDIYNYQNYEGLYARFCKILALYIGFSALSFWKGFWCCFLFICLFCFALTSWDNANLMLLEFFCLRRQIKRFAPQTILFLMLLLNTFKQVFQSIR